MVPVAQMVSASEAAALAGVELRDVHRVFDEGIFPSFLLADGPGRRVARDAIPLLAFYFGTAGVLVAEARRTVIERAAGRGRPNKFRRYRAPIPVGEGVIVDLIPFVQRAEERARLMERARAAVVTDPEVLGGAEPVLRGTRVPAYDVAAAVRRGTPREEILRDYPSLTAELIELAALYAEAERPRGRPRSRSASGLPSGARVVRSGSVRRGATAGQVESPKA